MRLRHAIAGLLVTAAFVAALPASAQTSVVTTAPGPLVSIAQQVYPVMEKLTGMPIAVLTRSDTDTANFYYMAMQTLCSKTGSNWCDTDLYGTLTDTTNPMGWVQVLNYIDTNNNNASVCVVLPPTTSLDPGYAASGLNGGGLFDWRDLTTVDEMGAWLTLLYAAQCQDKLSADPTESKRDDAFASLALTLMEGDINFVAARDVTPAKKFSFYRNTTSSAWAVNVGERILLELWKSQAGQLLTPLPCSITVATSTDLNTTAIQRDLTLPPDKNCTTVGPAQTTLVNNNRGGTNSVQTQASQPAVGIVTDANLWLWSYPAWGMTPTWPTVPMPPQPYTAFETFPSLTAAVTYVWQTSISISQQY